MENVKPIEIEQEYDSAFHAIVLYKNYLKYFILLILVACFSFLSLSFTFFAFFLFHFHPYLLLSNPCYVYLFFLCCTGAAAIKSWTVNWSGWLRSETKWNIYSIKARALKHRTDRENRKSFTFTIFGKTTKYVFEWMRVGFHEWKVDAGVGLLGRNVPKEKQ